MNNNELLLVWH